MSERRMMSRLPIARLAVEFVVIVIGVLVALGVDQWNERRQNDELARQVLRAVAAELSENHRQLTRRIEYHESILPGLDSLQRLAEAGNRTNILRSDALPQGIGFWLLKDTAWETAIVTEAVRHFDLAVTSLLSTTYSLQEALRENERAIADGVVRPEWFGAPDQSGAVIFLAVMLRDLMIDERELEKFQRASLDLIREQLGEDELGSPVEIS